MKKLYKIPGGPEFEVETEMCPWYDSVTPTNHLVVCRTDESADAFPASRTHLHDIPPIWQPPLDFRPSLAKWVAFDADGAALWYEKRPEAGRQRWVPTAGPAWGIGYVPESIRHLWRESLVELPEHTTKGVGDE